MTQKENIIKEFIQDTPIWYKGFSKELRDKPCVICGIKPSNLLKLSEKINQSRLSQLQEIIEMVEKMKTPKKDMNCYCDGRGKDLRGFCYCDFTKNDTLGDLIHNLKSLQK